MAHEETSGLFLVYYIMTVGPPSFGFLNPLIFNFLFFDISLSALVPHAFDDLHDRSMSC